MPRRLAVLSSLVLVLVLAAGTLAIASGDKGAAPARPAKAPAASGAPAPATAAGTGAPAGFGLGAGRHGGAMAKLVQKVVLDSLASRVAVEPKALKTAIHAVAVDQFEQAAKQAGLTSAETDALTACHTARVGARQARKAARTRGAAGKAARKSARRTRAAACDRTVIRPALKKLKALPEPDLAAKKTELADALGAQLGTTGAKVVEAVRAELEQRLGQAVGFGVLTEAGKTQALACFDGPATCDPQALRKELRGPLAAMAAAHRGHRGERGRHGHRR